MKYSIEIAIATYNRSNILKKWFQEDLSQVFDVGFHLSVYDSSTNNDTEKLVQEINKTNDKKIRYVHVADSLRLDEKILMSVLTSECDYVWPLGDSRTLDLEVVKNKVVPFIDKGYDVACVWSDSGLGNDGKTYTDVNEFFYDCFWHATWLGGIIFKRSIFDFNYGDKEYLNYMRKFNRNDGFSNMGMLFNVLAKKEKVRISFSEIGGIHEVSDQKTPGWLKRYLEVWCDNLCYVIDNLDEVYNPSKAKVLKEVWNVLSLDKAEWCYKARLAGGLSSEIYDYYDKLGLLDRVSDHKGRICFYAKSNRLLIESGYFVFRCKRKFKSGARKIYHVMKRRKVR